ncbi:uncharacterized protein SOCE26_050760 [Sorangium cellulosum]|uniref:Uncharacterized protein n=1 Tax=Sorangium cellulosum TaxID=56 RepID=A0A2L0EWF5_SORCE|nr:hypothetical protein [Sorangium cellulosum]AUX43624.1 uncharacterized protein SOCE26_050760 [Sorangium cellulosum]
MRIEKVVIAAAGTLMVSSAAAKVIGLKTNHPGLQSSALYLLVAGFCVLLLPVVALLVYMGYTTLFPGKRKDPPDRS